MTRILTLIMSLLLLIQASVLWDGAFTYYASSDLLDAWSWSNQVGPYQCYIYGDGYTCSDYVTLDQDQATVMINGDSKWNGQSMLRTELIPNGQPSSTGVKYYYWSMRVNGLDPVYEHQLVFFESHFGDIKFGTLSGQGYSDTLKFMLPGQSLPTWEIQSGTDWHDFILQVDYSVKTIALYHNKELVVHSTNVAGISQSEWHVGILRLPFNNQQETADTSVTYSGISIRDTLDTVDGVSTPAPTTEAPAIPASGTEVPLTKSPTTKAPTPPRETVGEVCEGTDPSRAWRQCGGAEYGGNTCCGTDEHAGATRCTFVTEHYSQCLPYSNDPLDPPEHPSTDVPVTEEPTTSSPTTGSPTTGSPTTGAPTTAAPTTATPTTYSPTTSKPTTASPTTTAPTTATPTTTSPTTVSPTTRSPTTAAPTTSAPTTAFPTTATPSTSAPTTSAPTTAVPTTTPPTTAAPTTASPSTASPTYATCSGISRVYDQCGGEDYQGVTCCGYDAEVGVTACNYITAAFSQCLPFDGQISTAPPTSASTMTITGPGPHYLSGVSLSSETGPCLVIETATLVYIDNVEIGPCAGVGIEIISSSTVSISLSTITSATSHIAVSMSEDIHIDQNTMINAQGPGGSCVSINRCAVPVEITRNWCEQKYGEESNPENNIEFFETYGTSTVPTLVQGNYIRGGGPSTSGCGILMGADGGAYQSVIGNTLVNPGQCGIGVSSGTSMVVEGNTIVSDTLDWTNVGVYIWDYYKLGCSDITFRNNVVNWKRKDGIQNDVWDGKTCGTIVGWTSNTLGASSLTPDNAPVPAEVGADPTTASPSTNAPTTAAPTTRAPTTASPTTAAPVSNKVYTSTVTISGTGPHYLSGVTISTKSGPCITVSSATNVIIEDVTLGPCGDRGVYITKSFGVTVRNSYIREGTALIYALNSGDLDFDQNTLVNAQGPSNPRGQCVQTDKCTAPVTVTRNWCEQRLGESDPEDNINFHKTYGTAENPILVQDNYIIGGGPSTTGCGILLADNGGAYQYAIGNTLVNPGQCGIGVSGGTNMIVEENYIYGAGFAWSNVGLYVWDYYNLPCSDITVRNNVINWIKKTGARNDVWDAKTCGTITGWSTNTLKATSLTPDTAPIPKGVPTDNTKAPTMGSVITAAPTTASPTTAAPVSNKVYTSTVTITGTGPHYLSGVTISTKSGPCITVSSATNVIIEDVTLGPCGDRGVYITKSFGVTVRNSYIREGTALIYALNSGDLDFDQNTLVNAQGPSNPRGQCVQTDKCTAPVTVTRNWCEQRLGESDPEDNINFHKTYGTAENPILVQDNYIIGGGPSTTGCGILLADNGGAYQYAIGNTLVNPGQCGIGVSGGTNMIVEDNYIYGAGFAWSNVGLYVWDYYNLPCSDITVRNNVINWIKKTGARNDVWDAKTCGTITGWSTNTLKATSLTPDTAPIPNGVPTVNTALALKRYEDHVDSESFGPFVSGLVLGIIGGILSIVLVQCLRTRRRHSKTLRSYESGSSFQNLEQELEGIY